MIVKISIDDETESVYKYDENEKLVFHKIVLKKI